MPGQRIPDLTAIAGASTANDDNLVIFDTDANTTKRILRSQLAAGLVGDLPYTPSGGISATTVPTAIAELDTEKTTLSAVLARLDDVDGSSLSGYMPAGITGTAQAGASTTITLASGASATDDAYNGLTVQITGGTGSGQVRTISDYVGSTKVATVSTAWTTTPDATSVYNIAYPRTAQSKMRDVVSVFDFMTAAQIADVQAGTALVDVTAAIQAAIDYWVSNEVDLVFPNGNYLALGEITASFSTTAAKGKQISGYGATITSSSAATALTITVDTALARNITISGLTITASAATDALLIDGKGPGGTGSQEYLFGIVLRDLVVNNSAGNGISVINNAFEITAIACHLNCNVGLLGSCFRFENVLGGGAIVSSISLFDCSTRGGTYGVVTVGTMNDVRIFGGTYLGAYYNGISLQNAYGGAIINAHVEANWVSAGADVEGHGGVSVVASGNFSIIGLYALKSGTYQTNAVNIYCGSSGHVQIIGGYSTATNYAYINGASSAATVTIIGKQTYNTTGVVRVAMSIDGVWLSNGIQFPSTQVPSSNANTLDDYAEGSFTPTMYGTSTAGTGTYIVQVGRYTKIGRLVSFDLEVAVSAHTGSGNMRIGGLPFTSNASTISVPSIYANNVALTAGNVAAALILTSSNFIIVNQIPTGGGAASNVPLDTNCDIVISGCYTV